jgi:ribosomal 50S subunit-recycling heat shock protein
MDKQMKGSSLKKNRSLAAVVVVGGWVCAGHVVPAGAG